MWTTKAQTSLRIRAVWSAPLLFAFRKVPTHINACYKRNFNFLASHCSWAGCFESHFVGNPEDRFSHVAAQFIMSAVKIVFLVLWRCPYVLSVFKKKYSFRDVSNPYLNPCPAHPKFKAFFFFLKTLKMQINCYWRDNLIALSLLSSTLLNLTYKMENRMSKGYSYQRGMMGGGSLVFTIHWKNSPLFISLKFWVIH